MLLYIPQIWLIICTIYELGRQADAQFVYLAQTFTVGGKTENQSRIAIRSHCFRSQLIWEIKMVCIY